MGTRWVRLGLAAVNAFVAVTAIGGGVALATGLEGDRFPLEMLRTTPFRSYVGPGLILAVVVGGSAAVAAAGVARTARWGAVVSTLAGVVLMGWIVGEILLLDQPAEPTGIEALYLALGALMAVAGGFASGSAHKGRPY